MPGESVSAPEARDPWVDLKRFTAARIAIGRTGGSQRTESILKFRLDHARARDAVQSPFDAKGVVDQLARINLPAVQLATQAGDRACYLLRPDLGRVLDGPSASTAEDLARVSGPVDLVIIVSDGLAAPAAQRHAATTIQSLVRQLQTGAWRVAPVCVVPYARVKLQDEIGQRLRASYSLMLLGERPGLGVSDSLGAYFTATPHADRTDADRNCISNIRAAGIPPAEAGAKLAWLLNEARRTGLSGIHLKDTQSGFTQLSPPA